MAGQPYRYTFGKFFRDWMLVVAMTVGASAYLVYHWIPALHTAGPALEQICKTVQPVLLFLMLFLSFCRIEPQQMKPHRWMIWLLLIQGLSFAGLAAVLIAWPELGMRIGVESAMLCMICPTATACAVVTGKLGGNMAGVVTYTVIINLLVALLVPLTVPLIHPVAGLSFASAFSKILSKVFPLLILPCLLAWIVRYLFPRLHALLIRFTDLPFYLWSVSLSLAILMSVRALLQSGQSAWILLEIAAASLVCCVFQFRAGHRIGERYGCRVSAGQALGQKNTVFSIWMAYTFMDPVVSVAGGFYTIWHNAYNSWQLYRRRKELEAGR